MAKGASDKLGLDQAKKPPSPLATLIDCPNEILDFIVSQLTSINNRHLNGPDNLKNTRLACPALSLIATRYLFSRISLEDETPERPCSRSGRDKLKNIIQHPHLVNAVKTLVWSPPLTWTQNAVMYYHGFPAPFIHSQASLINQLSSLERIHFHGLFVQHPEPLSILLDLQYKPKYVEIGCTAMGLEYEENETTDIIATHRTDWVLPPYSIMSSEPDVAFCAQYRAIPPLTGIGSRGLTTMKKLHLWRVEMTTASLGPLLDFLPHLKILVLEESLLCNRSEGDKVSLVNQHF